MIQNAFLVPRNGSPDGCKSTNMLRMSDVHKEKAKSVTAAQRNPEKVWEEVYIDLFGPIPNRNHVLVAQDNLSRYPTATTVKYTAAKPVFEVL